MLALAIAALVLACLALVIASAALVDRASKSGATVDGLRPGEKVVVHTRGPEGQSVRGVVVRELPTGIELAAPEHLQPDGSALELDGSVWLDRPFAYVQLVPTYRPLGEA